MKDRICLFIISLLERCFDNSELKKCWNELLDDIYEESRNPPYVELIIQNSDGTTKTQRKYL